MDYLEILDFCGFDVDAAKAFSDEAIREVLDEVGLEKMESKSLATLCGRLCCPCCCPCVKC